jgi:hypothetical protein
MSDITLNVDVTGLRVWKVRVWIGCQVIKLAALVMGTGIHIEMDYEEFERRDRRRSL